MKLYYIILLHVGTLSCCISTVTHRRQYFLVWPQVTSALGYSFRIWLCSADFSVSVCVFRWLEAWHTSSGWTTFTEICALLTFWLVIAWCVRSLTLAWPDSLRTMSTQPDRVRNAPSGHIHTVYVLFRMLLPPPLSKINSWVFHHVVPEVTIFQWNTKVELWHVLVKRVGMCTESFWATDKKSDKCWFMVSGFHKNEFSKPSSSNPNATNSN